MLKVDLARLRREGPQRITASVPPGDAMWTGSGFVFKEPVQVDLKALEAGGGEVVVLGRVAGTLVQECRRCLEPVESPLDEELTLVYGLNDELGPAEEGDVRRVPERAVVIDLSDAIREELILSATPYVVCSADCKGLCPTCGVDLNKETCACVKVESDHRWDALRALKNE